VKSHRSQAGIWTTHPGFFDGIRTSKVLPLHKTIALNGPLYLVEELYKAYPNGIKMVEMAFRRNVLHIACRYAVSIDLMKFIIEIYPQAADEEDLLGRLPLHYTCSNGCMENAIELLLKASTGSARAYDRKGWLPIHIACSMGASSKVVKMLVDSFPEAVSLQTNKGSSVFKCCEMAKGSKYTIANITILKDALTVYEQSKPNKAKAPTSVREVV